MKNHRKRKFQQNDSQNIVLHKTIPQCELEIHYYRIVCAITVAIALLLSIIVAVEDHLIEREHYFPPNEPFVSPVEQLKFILQSNSER